MIEVQFFRDRQSGCTPAQKDRLLSYMRNGRIFCASPSIKKDCMTGKDLPVFDYYQTDGKYVWSTEALYYLEKYNFDISTDFKNHVLN